MDSFLLPKSRENHQKSKQIFVEFPKEFFHGFLCDFGMVFGILLALKIDAERIQNFSEIPIDFLMCF